MLFMIRSSIDILSYTIGSQLLWDAVGITLVIGLLARRYAPNGALPSPTRWFCEMALLAVGPLCMLGWGRCFWPPEAGYSAYEAPAVLLLDFLALASVAAAVALVRRHRARVWRTLLVATLSLVWASGAFTVATFCIRDSWP